jgi:CHAD domain-containing protein
MRKYALLETANLLRRVALQANRAARSCDADSIHDLRVAIRRLSRCLRVFSQFYPGDSWKRIRKQLAGIMRLTGGVRDRDIALGLLADAGVSRRAAVVVRLRSERSGTGEELLLEIRRWRRNGFSQKWRARLEL